MNFKRHLVKVRKLLNPPYNHKEIFNLFALLILFLSIPIIAIYTQSVRPATPKAAGITDLVTLINQYRNQNGLGSLKRDQILTNAACWMARDMAENNYFSHTDSLGRFFGDRLRDFGIGNEWKGENLAAGTASPQTVFNQWKNSSGHRAIMLGQNYTRIGVGHDYKAGTDHGWYWAADFASELEDSATSVTNQCSSYSLIQGRKVVMPGNVETSPATSQTVTLDSSTSTSTNPYFFRDLTPGSHNVSITVPSGYKAGYTLCYNRIDCHNQTPTNGNSVNVNIPEGGYADLWWHFTPNQSADISADPDPCVTTSSTCTTKVEWQTTGYTNVYVCQSSSSGVTRIGTGTSGSVSRTLSLGKTYNFSVRTSSSLSCSGGTVRDSVNVYVYGVDLTAGDINCDNKINSTDALLVLRYVANLSVNTSGCGSGDGSLEDRLDFVDDDIITAVDALFILKLVAGLFDANTLSFSTSFQDSDADLLTDQEENTYSCLDPNRHDANEDVDADSIANSFATGTIKVNMDNGTEVILGSDPCKADTDGDGFNDGIEVYVGTSVTDRCANTTTANDESDDKWPSDFDDNRTINILDVTSFIGPVRHFGSSFGDATYNKRWDLDANGTINLTDVLVSFNTYPPMLGGDRAYGSTCPP